MATTCHHCNQQLDWRACWHNGQHYCPNCMASGQHTRYHVPTRADFRDWQHASLAAAAADPDGETTGWIEENERVDETP